MKSNPNLTGSIATRSSRRAVLQSGAAVLLAGTKAPPLPAASHSERAKLKVAIFSKHLQFLQGNELVQAAADMGFDGIDITVRKGGHVDPSRVKQDLPGLVATIRQHGLEVPMITTDIADSETPYAEDILQCMSELNIRRYRWGGFKYAAGVAIAAQIEGLRPRVAKLAALNAKYRVGAMYHTHSGFDLVGAPIWDLHILLNGLDPTAVGVNYDIGHATVEGGFGGWIESLRVTGPYLQGVAIKDFLWEKNAHSQWRPAWKPLGTGMVDFAKFFQLLADAEFSGPVQLHFEYPLQGADEGHKTVANPKEVFNTMARDLKQLRSYLAQAGLA
jgi:sugar phosphate isomerase/epimerase